jgi:di/tricarboxylate transporter
MTYVKEEKRWAGTPVLQGLISISLIIDLYLFILAILVEIIFKVQVFSMQGKGIIPIIILIQTIVLLIIYFMYGFKRKYISIVEKFKTEDDKARKKMRGKVWSFIILSLILGIITFIIGISH